VSAVPATKAGVAFTEIWLAFARFEDTGFAAGMEGKGVYTDETQLREADFKAKLESWVKRRKDDDPLNEALVRLTFSVGPKLQPTYTAHVSYLGRFQAAVDSSIDFDSFSSHFAVTYLVPFLRSKIAELTAESRYPRFLLAPLDVDDLIQLCHDTAQAEEASRVGETSSTSEERPTPSGGISEE
jgi:preprotein translocase subunit SecB